MTAKPETAAEVLAEMRAQDDANYEHYSQIKQWADRIERALSAQGEAVAEVVQCPPYEDGRPSPMKQLNWTGRNCENDFPVGTKFYAHPAPARVTDPWESGELGRSDEHVAVVPEPARVTQEMAREAVAEALRNWPEAESAILFMVGAVGPLGNVTESDIEWARTAALEADHG